MRYALTVLVAALVGLVGPVASPAAAATAVTAWLPPLPQPLTVVRGFDDPQPYAPGHRGVDLAAPPGALVRSPGAGIVRFAGPVAGRPVVSVDSGGLRFSYEPVLPRVRAGQRVTPGGVLGVLLGGHPGCRAGPGLDCLHWGLRQGTRYRDPLPLLRVRVRLLPLQAGPTRVADETARPRSATPPAALVLVLGVGVLALGGRRGGRFRGG